MSGNKSSKTNLIAIGRSSNSININGVVGVFWEDKYKSLPIRRDTYLTNKLSILLINKSQIYKRSPKYTYIMTSLDAEFGHVPIDYLKHVKKENQFIKDKVNKSKTPYKRR